MDERLSFSLYVQQIVPTKCCKRLLSLAIPAPPANATVATLCKNSPDPGWAAVDPFRDLPARSLLRFQGRNRFHFPFSSSPLFWKETRDRFVNKEVRKGAREGFFSFINNIFFFFHGLFHLLLFLVHLHIFGIQY